MMQGKAKVGSKAAHTARAPFRVPLARRLKWTATVWVHSMPFQLREYVNAKKGSKDREAEPGACVDMNDSCGTWAEKGECGKNPEYMHIRCPRACKQCEACAAGNRDCINRNREKLGLLLYNPAELDA